LKKTTKQIYWAPDRGNGKKPDPRYPHKNRGEWSERVGGIPGARREGGDSPATIREEGGLVTSGTKNHQGHFEIGER